MANQPHHHSVIETVTNTAVGYGINLGVQAVLFPYFLEVHVTLGANAGMGAIFTVVSVIRSYGLRRLFNRFHH